MGSVALTGKHKRRVLRDAAFVFAAKGHGSRVPETLWLAANVVECVLMSLHRTTTMRSRRGCPYELASAVAQAIQGMKYEPTKSDAMREGRSGLVTSFIYRDNQLRCDK
jgi:hypothetical protein